MEPARTHKVGIGFSEWRRYLGFYRGSSIGMIGLVALLTVVQVLAIVPIPLIIKHAFDVAIPEGDTNLIITLGLTLLGLQVGGAAATVGARYLILRRTKGVAEVIRRESIGKLYQNSIDYFRREEPGSIHDRVVHETTRIDKMSEALLARSLPAIVLVLGIAVVLAGLNARLFLLTFGVFPILLIVTRLLRRGVRSAFRTSHRQFERFSQGVLFVLRAMELTRLRAAEDIELAHQDEQLSELRDAETSAVWRSQALASLQQTVVAMTGIGVLVFGGIGVADGSLSLGELFSFYAGLAVLRTPLNTVINSGPVVIEGFQSLMRLFEFLDAEVERPYLGTSPAKPRGVIALKDVDFSYNGEKPILEDASMELAPGRVTGILGSNGSGKSTIVSLVLGLYRPSAGAVVIDGQPYDEIDMQSLRRNIGVVPQEPVMFHGTVYENITYGVTVDDLAVEEAIAAADAADFIKELPDGLETMIGEGGAMLSGGQRQRLAIARALVCRPNVLVLDEPTNHLDESAVGRIIGNLSSLEDRPTILLISHRPELNAFIEDSWHLKDGTLSKTEHGSAVYHEAAEEEDAVT